MKQSTWLRLRGALPAAFHTPVLVHKGAKKDAHLVKTCTNRVGGIYDGGTPLSSWWDAPRDLKNYKPCTTCWKNAAEINTILSVSGMIFHTGELWDAKRIQKDLKNKNISAEELASITMTVYASTIGLEYAEKDSRNLVEVDSPFSVLFKAYLKSWQDIQHSFQAPFIRRTLLREVDPKTPDTFRDCVSKIMRNDWQLNVFTKPIKASDMDPFMLTPDTLFERVHAKRGTSYLLYAYVWAWGNLQDGCWEGLLPKSISKSFRAEDLYSASNCSESVKETARALLKDGLSAQDAVKTATSIEGV